MLGDKNVINRIPDFPGILQVPAALPAPCGFKLSITPSYRPDPKHRLPFVADTHCAILHADNPGITGFINTRGGRPATPGYATENMMAGKRLGVASDNDIPFYLFVRPCHIIPPHLSMAGSSKPVNPQS
jgi:hypothetical protein